MSPKIYDCFLFFNELDLLKIRLETLWDEVDYFLVSEATKTFSGMKKPLYFLENRDKFSKYKSKIIHSVISDTPDSYEEGLKDFAHFEDEGPRYRNEALKRLYNCSGVPKGQSHWMREFYQRELVVKNLIGDAKENDLIIFSDVDEIPRPEKIKEAAEFLKVSDVVKFQQRMFQYYFNIEKNEDWVGSFLCIFGYIFSEGPNYIRSLKKNFSVVEDGGWHFTFLGGPEAIKTKIQSYGHQEFNNSFILSNIEKNIDSLADIFYQPNSEYRKVCIDDTYPKFLLEHLDEYEHLIKI